MKGSRTRAVLLSFHGDRLDLTVPVLLNIYKNDADERCRLVAVAGLRAIGDEASMQQMRLSPRSRRSACSTWRWGR